MTSIAIRQAAGGDFPLAVEVPTTMLAYQQGLSGWTALPDDRGMLFVMTRVAPYFSSAGMRIPLSLGFFDWQGNLMEIIDMPVGSATVSPSKAFTAYTLEVAQGWFERQSVQLGDLLLLPWPYDQPPPYPTDLVQGELAAQRDARL